MQDLHSVYCFLMRDAERSKKSTAVRFGITAPLASFLVFASVLSRAATGDPDAPSAESRTSTRR